MDKKLDVNSYREEKLQNREIIDLMKKTKVHEDKEFTKLFEGVGRRPI